MKNERTEEQMLAKILRLAFSVQPARMPLLKLQLNRKGGGYLTHEIAA